MTFFNSQNFSFVQTSGNNNLPQVNVVPLTGILANPFYLQNILFTANSAPIGIRIGLSTSNTGTNPVYFSNAISATTLSYYSVLPSDPIYVDATIKSIVFETTLAASDSASFSISYFTITNPNSLSIYGNINLNAGSNTGTLFTANSDALNIKSLYMSIPSKLTGSSQYFTLLIVKNGIEVNISSDDLVNTYTIIDSNAPGIILNRNDLINYTATLTSSTTLSYVMTLSVVS